MGLETYATATSLSPRKFRSTSSAWVALIAFPLMEQIPANLHAYVETQPSGNAINATHAEEVERNFRGDNDVAVAYVSSPDDVVDAIYEILSTEEEA